MSRVPHASAKTITGRIGEAHDLVVVAPAKYAGHRTEDLFLGDPHIVVNIAENSRLDKQAFAESLRCVPCLPLPGHSRLHSARDQDNRRSYQTGSETPEAQAVSEDRGEPPGGRRQSSVVSLSRNLSLMDS